MTNDQASVKEQKRLARREAAYQKLCTTIERTQRKLEKADKVVARSIRLLTQLDRKRRKMERQRQLAADEAVKPEPAQTEQVFPEQPPTWVFPLAKPAEDDLTIPASLDRRNKLPDPRTKEKKAERRAVEREVREAELTGKRRRMPLQGKEALAAINSK